jgi:hypothetical protein
MTDRSVIIISTFRVLSRLIAWRSLQTGFTVLLLHLPEAFPAGEKTTCQQRPTGSLTPEARWICALRLFRFCDQTMLNLNPKDLSWIVLRGDTSSFFKNSFQTRSYLDDLLPCEQLSLHPVGERTRPRHIRCIRLRKAPAGWI